MRNLLLFLFVNPTAARQLWLSEMFFTLTPGQIMCRVKCSLCQAIRPKVLMNGSCGLFWGCLPKCTWDHTQNLRKIQTQHIQICGWWYKTILPYLRDWETFGHHLCNSVWKIRLQREGKLFTFMRILPIFHIPNNSTKTYTLEKVNTYKFSALKCCLLSTFIICF